MLRCASAIFAPKNIASSILRQGATRKRILNVSIIQGIRTEGMSPKVEYKKKWRDSPRPFHEAADAAGHCRSGGRGRPSWSSARTGLSTKLGLSVFGHAAPSQHDKSEASDAYIELQKS